MRLIVGLPHEQRGRALAVRQWYDGGLVVWGRTEVEVDSGEPPVVVPIIGQAAAPSRRDQQILGAVAVHVVPRNTRPELAQRLREQGLAHPIIERRLDVPVAEPPRHVAEPWPRACARGQPCRPGVAPRARGARWLLNLVFAIRLHASDRKSVV